MWRPDVKARCSSGFLRQSLSLAKLADQGPSAIHTCLSLLVDGIPSMCYHALFRREFYTHKYIVNFSHFHTPLVPLASSPSLAEALLLNKSASDLHVSFNVWHSEQLRSLAWAWVRGYLLDHGQLIRGLHPWIKW